jgi:hypothetical protein
VNISAVVYDDEFTITLSDSEPFATRVAQKMLSAGTKASIIMKRTF